MGRIIISMAIVAFKCPLVRSSRPDAVASICLSALAHRRSTYVRCMHDNLPDFRHLGWWMRASTEILRLAVACLNGGNLVVPGSQQASPAC
jgi:hypothetical protein